MSEAMARRVEELAVDRWFRRPPRMIASMASQPTLGVTRAFVVQWTKFSRLFPRWVGAIMANCTEPAVVAYEVQNLMSEVVIDPAGDDNHYELLIRLGQGVGLTRRQIEDYPVLAEAEEVFAWLWGRARDPDWLVGFSAVNGLEILGDGDLPRRYGLAQGTGIAPMPYAASLGLDQDTLQFFEVSDRADAGHGHETVQIIARHTAADRQDEVLGVLDESMSCLRRMMEAMWGLAEKIDAAATRGGD